MNDTDYRKKFVILRRPRVEKQVGLPRSTMYKFIGEGKFPRPIQLGPRSVGWIQHEIEAWIKERVASRDKEEAGV